MINKSIVFFKRRNLNTNNIIPLCSTQTGDRKQRAKQERSLNLYVKFYISIRTYIKITGRT